MKNFIKVQKDGQTTLVNLNNVAYIEIDENTKECDIHFITYNQEECRLISITVTDSFLEVYDHVHQTNPHH
jgi:hypothetical protein